MTIKLISKNILLLPILLTLLLSGIINHNLTKPEIEVSKQNSALNIDNFFLNSFIGGQNRLLSSFLWIMTLLESDLEHYKEKNLNSWMYLRFNSITSIDPLFLHAYQFGAKYLMIVKDDLYGAKVIFEKGLKLFPNDYDLIFHYGFLLAFELSEYEEAVVQYKKILKHPKAPPTIKSLIPKLMFQKNKSLMGIFPFVQEIYRSEPEGTILKKKLEKDLYAIKAEHDLNCLNSQNLGCSEKDLYGEYYIKKGETFVSPLPFTKYQLHKNN